MKGRYILLLLVYMLAVSCEGWLCPDKKNKFDRVMILYAAGCNSLSKDIKDNINDLKTGFIPDKKDKKALIVISHNSAGYLTFSPETESYIIRMYKSKSHVVCDTLKSIPAGKFLTQPSVMKEALGYVKDSFKSEHYGMVFSSHATGWLPEGYYNSPEAQGNNNNSGLVWSAPRRSLNLPEGAVLYYEPEHVEGEPLTKSIGQEDTLHGDIEISYEMSQVDFAANIPMHLDYLIFDACLMGCIETAYELRNITDRIAFSPTEVLQYGFQYKTIASHLLEGAEPDVYKACKDYFDKYDTQSDQYKRSATITLVDCSKLDRLATLCQELVTSCREGLDDVDPSQVQPFFRSYHHWYYDLEDVFVKAGISETQKNNLRNAIDACVLYKAATPTFLITQYGSGSGFWINTYSGFSMYLPCNGSPYLDDFYKTLAWNKATGLVQ